MVEFETDSLAISSTQRVCVYVYRPTPNTAIPISPVYGVSGRSLILTLDTLRETFHSGLSPVSSVKHHSHHRYVMNLQRLHISAPKHVD